MKIYLNKSEQEVLISKNEKDPIIMYVIVNAALQLSPGKLAVQVGHGVEIYFRNLFNEEIQTKDVAEDVFAWTISGSRKVVLKANPSQWKKIKELTEIFKYTVIDVGLTEVLPGSETCMIIPPTRKSKAHKLIKKLQLL